MPSFKQGDDLNKWADLLLWNPILQHSGGAALQQWTYEQNYLVNGLQPRPPVLHVTVHGFTTRDADPTTLEAMFECGEIQGSSFAPTAHLLAVGDEAELRVDLPTDIEDEYRPEWVNKRATIAKVGDGRFLIHFDTNPHPDSKIEWVPAKHVRRAVCTLGFSTHCQQGRMAYGD